MARNTLVVNFRQSLGKIAMWAFDVKVFTHVTEWWL